MKYKLDEAVHGSIGIQKYQCSIGWKNGKMIADEPESSGGKATGPDPYTLLMSSLLACSLITMRMYIDRKGWDIPEIAMNANLYQETADGKLTTTIDREIVFISPVNDEQRKRLKDIIKLCPVSKLLENDIVMRTVESME